MVTCSYIFYLVFSIILDYLMKWCCCGNGRGINYGLINVVLKIEGLLFLDFKIYFYDFFKCNYFFG